MYKQLTREQRYVIYVEKYHHATNKSIAEKIGVSESTISRELKRNAGRNGGYLWLKAHEKALSRRSHTVRNHTIDDWTRWRVKDILLSEDWSPQQISGFLKKEGMYISHETIYKMIRDDETGRLAFHCRHKMKYRKRKSKNHLTKATNIKSRVSIHERPIEADGTRFGDWEMDTIIGKDGCGAILTLTERSTNMLLMEKLKEGKRPKPLAKVVWRLLLPYMGDGVKTITTDNGSEFAEHKFITERLKAQVYFADSYCSWQKGAIENANKLIRQYIPKGTDFNDISDMFIKKIQHKINTRPRKKLNFNTPLKEFYKHFY